MDKRFAAILVACVLALGALFWFTSSKKPDGSGGSSSTLSNHVKGKNTKGVTLVEYGDLQCPACGAYYPITKQIIAKYQDDIAFQFRNFPLSNIHQNARAAARAAEAADKQGKYWEMHDLLYEQQKSWESLGDPVSTFNAYAQQLGLNVTTFKQDYSSSPVNSVINADYDQGVKLGIDSTPTFFLQNKKLTPNPQDIDSFSKLIDEAIKNAQKK